MAKSFIVLLASCFFLQFIQIGNCIFIRMEERIPHCFRKKVSPNEHLLINYVITGAGESQVKMEIFQSKKNFNTISSPLLSSRDPKAIYTIQGKNEFEYKLTPEVKEDYEICFRNLDNKSKVINYLKLIFVQVLILDLMIEKHKDKDSQDDMNEALNLITRSLKHVSKIKKNQYTQFMRDLLHAKKINQTEIKIKWCAFVKIQVLIVLSLVQIYILTSFFKKKDSETPGI